MHASYDYASALTALFRAVLQASWQGSLAIVLVLLTRRLLGMRVPARWHHLLWFLVLARLLVPAVALPHSPASLENLPSIVHPFERPPSVLKLEKFTVDPGLALPVSPVPARAAAAGTAPRPAPGGAWSPWVWAAWVWLGGVLLFAGWLAVCVCKLRVRLRRETLPVEESVLANWQACCQRWLGHAPPRLLAADWVESPALVGWWRPTLLIPQWSRHAFSSQDWEHVFAHEIAHLRWRDHWSQLFLLAAGCVHWFNPVVWLGLRRLRADRELAADEWVLRHLQSDRALAYGETLFKTLAHRPVSLTFQPGMVGISEDGAQMRQRLRRITAFLPRRRVFGSLTGLAAVLALGTVVLGQGSPAPSPAPLPSGEAATPAAPSVESLAANAQKFSDALLAAARAGNSTEVGRLIDSSSTPRGVKFSEGEATSMLNDLVRQRDLTAFTTLHDQLKQTNYGKDWKPGDELLTGLVKNNRTDFLDALLARRLDLTRLKTLAASADESSAAWITRRVAEVAKQRADLEALGKAAADNDLPALQRLVDAGVDVNGVGKDDNTPLIRAVSRNRLEAAQWLLDHGALVDKPRFPGWNYTPLCLVNSVPMAELLKKNGADVRATLYENGTSILTYVASHARADVVAWFLKQGLDAKAVGGDGENLLFDLEDGATAEALLEAGADPNQTNKRGRTPLTEAQTSEVARALIQHGADLKPKLPYGGTLLEYVVNNIGREKRDPQRDAALIDELIKQGAEFDPKGNGIRAMIAAAFSGRVGEVRAFLDHGVSPNAQYEGLFEHSSALGSAADQAPSREVVKLLLARGADPNLAPLRGQLGPLASALIGGAFDNADLLRQAGARGVGDLSYYSARGDVAKVNELLGQKADPNEADVSGWTPLRYAMQRLQVEVIKLLVEHGASVDQFDAWGMSAYLNFALDQTAMGWDTGQAQRQWHLSPQEVNARLAALQQLFTPHPPDPSYRDRLGRTALHQAALAGNSMVLGVMLDGKHPRFDPNLPDHEGRTPLLLAALSPVTRQTEEIITSDMDTPQQKTWNQQAHMANELLKAGARLDLVVPGGETVGELALAAARDANNPQLVSVLSEAMPPHPVKGNDKAPTPADSPAPAVPALPYKLTVTPEIKKAFPGGDGIEIQAVTGTAPDFQVSGTYRITGVCRQQTLENATLYVGNTAEPGADAIAPLAGSSLYEPLPRGSTGFDFTFTPLRAGVLHLTVYDLDHHDKDDNAYAGLFLGKVVPAKILPPVTLENIAKPSATP